MAVPTRPRSATSHADAGEDALGRSTADDGAGASGVLAAVWCRSVGTSWTLELQELDEGGPGRGRVVDWVSSGVPISQLQPDALARELLAERGLALFGDSSVGPCTHNRRGIGYVAQDAELIALAHLVADETAEVGRHPVMLAAQWVAAGFCVDTAAGWIRQGVHSPQAAQRYPIEEPGDRCNACADRSLLRGLRRPRGRDRAPGQLPRHRPTA